MAEGAVSVLSLTSVAREARQQLERADPEDAAAVGAWDGVGDLGPGAAASAQHRQLHFHRAVKRLYIL